MDIKLTRLANVNDVVFNEAVELDAAEVFAALSAECKTDDRSRINVKQRYKFRERCRRFPEGQIIAYVTVRQLASDTSGMQPVGVASSLRVAADGVESLPEAWRALTNSGCFTTHKPDGNTLVCASMSARRCEDARYIRGALMDFQLDLAKRLGVARVLAYARPSEYWRYSILHGKAPIEAYLRDADIRNRATEGLAEPYDEVGFHVLKGAKIAHILPNGRPHDSASLGHIVIMDYSHLLR